MSVKLCVAFGNVPLLAVIVTGVLLQMFRLRDRGTLFAISLALTPVIIFNHGYIPPDVYRTTERYVAYVDLIARSGYIVLRSDYRGHDRSEAEARGELQDGVGGWIDVDFAGGELQLQYILRVGAGGGEHVLEQGGRPVGGHRSSPWSSSQRIPSLGAQSQLGSTVAAYTNS